MQGGMKILESVLVKAYRIKLQDLNFEGPFDLLFHLIEKNKINICDIPINDIADQYMEYLFAMQDLDLEIASEFLVMAATLLHIKSKTLLPDRVEKPENEHDPREELVTRLLVYKCYKEFANVLADREKEWEKVFYKLPEIGDFAQEEETIELSSHELRRVYLALLDKNRKKMNSGAKNIEQIVEHEKVSLKNKMREVLRLLTNRSFFRFSEVFSPEKKSRMEVVTGFLAVLELARLKRAKLVQKRTFSDIMVCRRKINQGEMEKRKRVGGDW